MDRRLLFPAAVVTAWAQQTSPATAEAEKALRARAEQFYRLEVDKKFRQAEAFTAEDTKDYYYNNSKPDIKKFSLANVEFSPDGTHAKITVMITAVMSAPLLPAMEFTAASSSLWKLENGEWVYYVIQDGDIDTPFGKWHVSSNPDKGAPPQLPSGMMVDPSKIQTLVTIDRTSVEIGGQNRETVTISNHMSGVIDLKVSSERPQGLLVSVDKDKLGPAENGVVSFSAASGAKPSGTVRISAGPLQDFLIQVRTK